MKKAFIIAILAFITSPFAISQNTYPWPQNGNIGIGTVLPQSHLHITHNSDYQYTHLRLAEYDPSRKIYKAWVIDNNAGELNFNFGSGPEENIPIFTKYLYLTSDGKMGIGVTPTEKLVVAGNILQNGAFYIGTEKVKGINANGLKLLNNNNQGIMISNNGSVGINITSPATQPNAQLHIYQYGPSGNKFRLEHWQGIPGSPNFCWDFENYLGILSLKYGQGNTGGSNPTTTTMFGINYLGNVGIGTDPTSNKLTVNGNISATSFTGNGAGLTNVPGDNLGNHIATQNIQLAGKWLSGDGGNEGLFINSTGNVGIGTSNFQAKLHVETNEGTGLIVKTLHSTQWGYGIISSVLNDDTKSFVVIKDDQDKFITYGNGRTIIGNSNSSLSGYMLKVHGKIIAEELKIVLDVPSSDFVFYDDYALMSLSNLENFIKENNHLPEIPSAAEFKTNGYEVGKMDDLLLRKVEELTLYIIAQQKEIEMLKEQVKSFVQPTN